MPRRTYTIHVEVLDCVEDETAIAQAAAYLAYADQTDSVGPDPTFDNVRVQHDGAGRPDRPLGVDLTVTLHLSDRSHKRFVDEMTALRKVLSVER